MWFGVGASAAATQQPSSGRPNKLSPSQANASSSSDSPASDTTVSQSASNNSADFAGQNPAGSPVNLLAGASNANLGQVNKISFHFKTSIFTRRITIDSDRMALGLIKQLAISFINEIYFQHPFPANSYIGDYISKHFSTNDNLNNLYNRLMLRILHLEQGTLAPFNSVSDIEPESYICIELDERQQSTAAPQTSQLGSATAKANLLSSPRGCSGAVALAIGSTSINLASTSPSDQAQHLKILHEFHQETYFIPTHCASCSTLIKGMYKQGYQCGFCKKNFCPKCKVKAEEAGYGCLAPIPPAPTTSINAPGGPLVSPIMNILASKESNDDSSSTNPDSATGNKLEVGHPNMSKRKSASNLLHFANPFKSHHVQQQPQQQQQSNKDEKSGRVRGSTGALDPVLQQLSKSRDQTDDKNSPGVSTNQDSGRGNNLMVVQAAHLSSSHHNLFSDKQEQTSMATAASSQAPPADPSANQAPGSSSVHQSPIGSSRGQTGQLSNSINDLPSVSPTRRDQGNHSFISMDWIQIYGEPTCGVCKKPLKNQPAPQQSPPCMCKCCKLQVHAQCQSLILADCLSRITESSRAAAERVDSPTCSGDNTDSQAADGADKKTSVQTTNSNASRDNIRLHRLAPSVKHMKRPDATKPIIEGWLKHTTSSDEQARKHFWRLDDTDITLYENDTSARYFKAIALNKIIRVIPASSLPKLIREDIITAGINAASNAGSGGQKGEKSRSANASPAKSPELKAQMNAMFGFELNTGSVYLVQANDEIEASKWKGSLADIIAKKSPTSEARASESIKKPDEAQPTDPSVGVSGTKTPDSEETPSTRLDAPTKGGQLVEQPARASMKQTTPAGQRTHHHHHHQSSGHHHRGQPKSHGDPNRSRLYNRPRITIELDTMKIPDHFIEGKYLIERDRSKGVGFEELGSGQFGKVYAAISEVKPEPRRKGVFSGVPVAIKEISKARFDLRQQAKLKNEATILSRLDHPGVIILERVHDLPDKIYIVMEQLEDDMLEMIVSTEEKRLNERVTKFLTYQILEALKYLHAQNIAHCDLKPENVLLVERRSQFPQIKLCDFGFAKMMEENSFRSSLVGTPAYLAPEVVKGERYNRSVDLWSVGVIVYVSLSGEFPFNEGENIHDQISRANFMYPDQPWAKISQQAKNFINSLLRVNCEKRLSANRAQMDDWIQDFQLWCDLCELEARVGKRWVTDDADFERWSRYAKERGLQVPRSAMQLHEDLIAD